VNGGRRKEPRRSALQEVEVENVTDSEGGRNSVYPPTEMLTFGPWIYMVPQFRPDDVLMLGYAGGTVAGLIRLFYGAVPIVAVDVNDQTPYSDRFGIHFVHADAREFVTREMRTFDCVVVDLFEDGEHVPCGFVTEPEFVENVSRIGRYLIVHAKNSTDMSNYGEPLKVLTLNDSHFHYFMVERIDRLPIR
jgi:hypothetical protein